MTLGYPVDALEQDREAGLWQLDDHFDHEIEMLDLVHDSGGSRLVDVTGSIRVAGVLTADIPVLLERAGGGTIRLDRIEIDGRLVMFLPSEYLTPGELYREAAPLGTGARPASPEEIALMPAFGPGTMIATDDGPQPIDWLRPGDRVLTRDNGYRPLLWLGTHNMPRRAPEATRPRAVAAEAFGPLQPERDLLLSPQTGILLAGTDLELWFGESEMFAAAEHLAPQAAPAEGHRTLYTLLFDTPEVVLAEGLWVASVHADASFAQFLPDRVRAALMARLKTGHKLAARATLADWEVAMFRHERTARSQRLAA